MALSVRRVPALLLSLLLPLGLQAQQLPWQAHGQPEPQKDPVVYLYPEQLELTVGQLRAVDLHFRIRAGLHINTHTPLDKNFIRTDLIVAEPPGIEVQSITFPDGEAYASKAFPGEPLRVYTGEVVLHARIKATRAGEQMLNAALRYQACDAEACLPPKKAVVMLDLVAR